MKVLGHVLFHLSFLRNRYTQCDRGLCSPQLKKVHMHQQRHIRVKRKNIYALYLAVSLSAFF